MNGKFKTILFGFKRRDVIDYIKLLSSEKGRLEEENAHLTNELQSVKDELDTLKAAAADSTSQLEALESSLNETRRLLSASEGELQNISNTLSGIFLRLKECLSPVNAALSGAHGTPEDTEAAE